MFTYQLFGERLINNDRTMRDFATCVMNSVPTDDIQEMEQRYRGDFKDHEFEEEFMRRASENKDDWKTWIVKYSDGSFIFDRDWTYRKKPKHEENLLCLDEIELYGLVVVGNIHDNPNLLPAQEPEIYDKL